MERSSVNKVTEDPNTSDTNVAKTKDYKNRKESERNKHINRKTGYVPKNTANKHSIDGSSSNIQQQPLHPQEEHPERIESKYPKKRYSTQRGQAQIYPHPDVQHQQKQPLNFQVQSFYFSLVTIVKGTKTFLRRSEIISSH